MRDCSGGHAWLLWGGAWLLWGVCVVLFRGACVVLFGGCAWFYSGGMHGFIRGGMHGFIHGFIWGGYAWFYLGGMHGFFSFFRYNEILSMSGRYASYWNAFLFNILVLGLENDIFLIDVGFLYQ